MGLRVKLNKQLHLITAYFKVSSAVKQRKTSLPCLLIKIRILNTIIYNISSSNASTLHNTPRVSNYRSTTLSAISFFCQGKEKQFFNRDVMAELHLIFSDARSLISGKKQKKCRTYIIIYTDNTQISTELQNGVFFDRSSCPTIYR